MVHAVNNGAARLSVIKGLPVTKNTKVTVYVTNSRQGMEEVKSYKIANNGIEVNFPAVSFVSVFVN
ncbi:MAG: hypothetical protein LBO71_10820 [Prevotellaceae bacterium]|nr:hypothetical protein [Prevotellaceae bacterium]